MDSRTGIVSVTAETTYPHLSAQIVEEFTSALSEYNSTHRKTVLVDVQHFLADRLDESNESLMRAEETLAVFRANNRNYAGSDNPELARDLGRLTRDVALKNEIYLTLNQQYLMVRLEAQKEVPAFQVLDHPRPATVKSGPARMRGTLLVALSVVVFSIGTLVAWRWITLLVGPDESRLIKSMATEITGDISLAFAKVRRLPVRERR